MICMSYHPHAFYDADGVVLNVASFGGHDNSLVEEIARANGYHGWVSLCEHPNIKVGDIWNGESAISTDPVPPSPSFPEEWLDEDPELANIPGVTFF